MSDRTDVRREDARITNPSAVSSAKLRAALSGIPQQPTTEKADRSGKVTVSVRGQAVIVDCPAWCVLPHSENYMFLEDVSHQGEEIALAAPEFNGVFDVMVTSLRQWPFCNDEDRGAPYLGFDATGEGDVANLQGPAALAFIDQATTHLAKMRAQVQQLIEAQQS
ncbi:DUF6907 domain-containing protein [Streptomyces coffeae]|uniref:Uncharacterized protein n=1 Tax=Streptomyces coffeae TaxID=621382 RepID=A0ABS1NKZ3_9ACTN|nr:hypothetical protein [Streptomyces coffeae]MBL1100620.1 hypothetical protein [Streptomyces coffeae]